MTVTPKMAEDWLKAAGKNRNMKPSRVALYSQMVKRDEWYATCQGIGFDTRGRLIDGQHRLTAIIVADKPALLLVVRGLDPASQMVLDQPAVRQAYEQIKIARGIDVTPRHIAIAKVMMTSVRDSDAQRVARSDTLILERYYMEWHEGINYVCHAFDNVGHTIPRVTIAPVQGPLARAYYTHQKEHEMIDEFAEILVSGFTSREQASAAIALRNWLIGSSKSARRFVSRMETYKKTELALKAFYEKQTMRKVPTTPLETELFPLPNEKPIHRDLSSPLTAAKATVSTFTKPASRRKAAATV